MTTPVQFNQGDLLFRQGDPSDFVLWVRYGEVEVLREVRDISVLIGHVREGEWLGEMGVIESRPRSATARASRDGAAEMLTAREFLDRVSSDATLARSLIQRLSIRLRTIEDKVAGDLLLSSHGPQADERTAPAAPGTAIAEDAPITLTAQSDTLRARIGSSPIAVGRLPFVVGRFPVRGEAPPPRPADLSIEDQQPFRLSRDHFMITRDQDRLFVSDLGSTLGTVVNGQAIGHNFMRDTAPLRRGDNRIVAGGLGSPFDFLLSVG